MTSTSADAVGATGVGSWPGTDVRRALRVVRDAFTEGVPEGVEGMPYLPELPGRGPGADMLGRSAHLLLDLPVDLQPQGWRLVDRPGRDHERAGSWWRQDLDELAEAFDGWVGPLKLQVAGPWTLASSLWLPLGDKVLSDPGATRDLCLSLAEGVTAHVREVRRLVPGAEVVLQVDEPSLTAVALGHIRSESGYRVLRTPEQGELVTALRGVVDGARAGGAVQVVAHSCADDVPLDLLAGSGADAVSLDVALLDTAGWERVATAMDAGLRLWAGLLPTRDLRSAPDSDAPARHVADLARRWSELGLPLRELRDVTVTPACGLAAAVPEVAAAVTAATVQAAARLAELAEG
jgi:methionine synthase II (cobalamin-independent)